MLNRGREGEGSDGGRWRYNLSASFFSSLLRAMSHNLFFSTNLFLSTCRTTSLPEEEEENKNVIEEKKKKKEKKRKRGKGYLDGGEEVVFDGDEGNVESVSRRGDKEL